MNSLQKLSCLAAFAVLVSVDNLSLLQGALAAGAPPATIAIDKTIAQTLNGPHMENISTLLIALQAADLLPSLEQKGPFTLFAPTNAAFAKLPKGTLEKLLKPENKERLIKIFALHLVPENDDSKKLRTLKEVKTLEDDKLKIQIKADKITLGNDKATATVIKADIHCSNGTIHFIDTVLAPD